MSKSGLMPIEIRPTFVSGSVDPHYIFNKSVIVRSWLLFARTGSFLQTYIYSSVQLLMYRTNGICRPVIAHPRSIGLQVFASKSRYSDS